MSTLLEKALSIPSRKRRKNSISTEDEELVLAHIRGLVTVRQVCAVKGWKGSGGSMFYAWATKALTTIILRQEKSA